jgi:hypothetical protein
MNRLGCYWYVGKTQSGKTRKAYADLSEDVLATGRPSLIIDPMPAWNFAKLPHVKSVRDVIHKLYQEGTHAVYTPETPDEVDQIMRAIRAGRRVHVLWDECSFQMSWRSITEDTSRALRGWAHAELTFRLVTQRPGDIHGDAYACDPEVYAFRTEKEGDLDRLRKEFAFDPEKLKLLGQGEYLVKKRGF